MRKEAGAGVSIAIKRRNTPLLASFAAVSLELARVRVDVKAVRQDGTGLLALAIHSKRLTYINFALRHGPEGIRSQGTLDSRAFDARAQIII